MDGDKFFEKLTPEVVHILGTALMQLLVDQAELSREALVEIIQVMYQENDTDLAVEVAIDVLRLPGEQV
ncbi:hypothetical protein [Pantoea sp.]|uniref:hypothetical protein n=1 Tax=Pantoea sp. TaxID=69393 RepID=UPI0028AD0B58|nr:hypothetical protein [Pantoea sp.]